MKLIDKDAVVAEIEKNKKHCTKIESVSMEAGNMCGANNYRGRVDMCNAFLSYINTLEMKEVDLEVELNNWRHNHFHGRRDKDANGEYLERTSQLEIAKHFFELGMSVNIKAQKGEEV